MIHPLEACDSTTKSGSISGHKNYIMFECCSVETTLIGGFINATNPVRTLWSRWLIHWFRLYSLASRVDEMADVVTEDPKTNFGILQRIISIFVLDQEKWNVNAAILCVLAHVPS
jgi:hypothetical protein